MTSDQHESSHESNRDRVPLDDAARPRWTVPKSAGALRRKRHHHNSYRSIAARTPGGEKLAIRLASPSTRSADRVRHAGRRTKCWCTWHRGPRRTRRRLPEVLPGPWRPAQSMPIGLLRLGQKVPRKAGLGAISRRSAGTPASGGRYSRWHPQRVERFQPGTN